jgi:hypothetical protein
VKASILIDINPAFWPPSDEVKSLMEVLLAAIYPGVSWEGEPSLKLSPPGWTGAGAGGGVLDQGGRVTISRQYAE